MFGCAKTQAGSPSPHGIVRQHEGQGVVPGFKVHDETVVTVQMA